MVSILEIFSFLTFLQPLLDLMIHNLLGINDKKMEIKKLEIFRTAMRNKMYKNSS